MKFRMLIACGLMSLAAILSSALVTDAEDEAGFKPLFDGKTLDGWTLTNKQGPGYVIEDEVLVCPAEGGGNLFTSEEYSDFVLRFEVKMQAGGNNGVGIRSPLEGDPRLRGHGNSGAGRRRRAIRQPAALSVPRLDLRRSGRQARLAEAGGRVERRRDHGQGSTRRRSRSTEM